MEQNEKFQQHSQRRGEEEKKEINLITLKKMPEKRYPRGEIITGFIV